jgi:hypothetical protein
LEDKQEAIATFLAEIDKVKKQLEEEKKSKEEA